MSHQINSNGDFVSLKQIPWHGLGTVLEDDMGLEEALHYGGLNFEVAKSPNIHRLPDGSEKVSKTSFFTYRTDNNRILGDSVGSQYTPLQNRECFSLIDEVIEKGNLLIETAGTLSGGNRVFMTLKMKNPIVVNGSDESYQYLVMANGHDGTLSAQAYFTTIRVVCNNTLNLSLRCCTQKQVIRHTKNVLGNYSEALRILGVLEKNQEAATAIYGKLASTRMAQRQFWDYIGNVFLDESDIKQLKKGAAKDEVISVQRQKVLDQVLAYAYEGPGQEQAGEMSAWWAYNAVTGYLSNVKEYKTEERRMQGLLWKKEADLMAHALRLAHEPEAIIKLSADPLTNFSLN